MDNEVNAVKAVMRELQNAWLEYRYEDMYRHLHPEVAFMKPDLSGCLNGKSACVETFVAFGKEARVKDFDTFDLQVCTWKGKAMITYRFTISYTIAGNLYRETGNDVLMFVKDTGSWTLLWRAMVNNEKI